MLLTRAPLKKSNINTRFSPYDLHVLNTPPAFVLSQNQTLRKKFGWRIFRSPKTSKITYSKLTLAEFFKNLGKPRLLSSAYRAFFRAAHNSIFFFIPTRISSAYDCFEESAFARLLARFSLGHIVKELVSRGLKSRSGFGSRIRALANASW